MFRRSALASACTMSGRSFAAVRLLPMKRMRSTFFRGFNDCRRPADGALSSVAPALARAEKNAVKKPARAAAARALFAPDMTAIIERVWTARGLDGTSRSLKRRGAVPDRFPQPMPSAPLDLETYYSEAGMDYRAWSRKFNMHFGFYRWGMNPFRLENMLEEMSRQVFARLALEPGMQVLDLGCGLGAPARTLIAEHPVAVTAVTKVEWQIAMAQQLERAARPEHRGDTESAPRGTITWTLGDYTALDLPAGFYQGAFSIEASCHAHGVDKAPFIAECARLLAPGARLVVADGFLKRRGRLPRWYAALLEYMTRRWAVEQFAEVDAFRAGLADHGFEVLAIEEISWRIV